jgi:hypothetical protein
MSGFSQDDDKNINKLMKSSDSEQRRNGTYLFEKAGNAANAMEEAKERMAKPGATSPHLEKEFKKAQTEYHHALWMAERDAKEAKKEKEAKKLGKKY